MRCWLQFQGLATIYDTFLAETVKKVLADERFEIITNVFSVKKKSWYEGQEHRRISLFSPCVHNKQDHNKIKLHKVQAYNILTVNTREHRSWYKKM